MHPKHKWRRNYPPPTEGVSPGYARVSARSTAMTALLVVTDLDGTLLDHHSCDFTPAAPALARLRAMGVPVVLNSSKTRKEMLQWRVALNNQSPFVFENGAVLAVQENAESFHEYRYGIPRSFIRTVLETIAHKYHFRYQPFFSMTVTQLVELTGLTPDLASLALEREYSEPLLWQDDDRALGIFADLLQGHDLHVVRGGRFVHVSGHTDKGACLDDLMQWYYQQYQQKPLVLALGDGANDLPLLQIADFAVQIRSLAFDFPEVSHPNLIRTELPGPAGWNTAVQTVLDMLS